VSSKVEKDKVIWQPCHNYCTLKWHQYNIKYPESCILTFNSSFCEIFNLFVLVFDYNKYVIKLQQITIRYNIVNMLKLYQMITKIMKF